MDENRYHLLNKDAEDRLTEEELSLGWHFCVDWDCMLVGPSMGEYEQCQCGPYEAAKTDAEDWPKRPAKCSGSKKRR